MCGLKLMTMAAVLAILPAIAVAQEVAPDCSVVRPDFPPELAGWSTPIALVAAAKTSRLRGAAIVPGQAAAVTLLPTASVRYALRPEKPGGSVSYGGMLRFTIAEQGAYRIALGSGAWIDIVKDGKAIDSTAHGHGPACTGIRKMVDFPLTPGRYVLQIAANGAADLPLMLVRLP